MQRAGTTRASQGEWEKAGPPARLQGAGEKNRAGRRPKGAPGRERANPSRPLQSRGAGPAAGGGKPEPPTTTTSNRGGRGWRRIGTRAQNPPSHATGPSAPHGGGGTRGGAQCGFFAHTLEGLGTPRRVLRRGGPSAAQTRATRGRALAAPRAPGKPRHRRAACGPLYRVAKGGGPRTARLRATSPRRGGRHHRHALKR